MKIRGELSQNRFVNIIKKILFVLGIGAIPTSNFVKIETLILR